MRFNTTNLGTFLVSAMVMALALILASCGRTGGRKQYGLSIPAEIAPTPLEAVLAKPEEFHGKKVVVEGIVSGQCPSLCEFFLKDSQHVVEIYPQGFSLPRMESGRRVTAYVQVTKGEERLVFSALGLVLE